MMGDGEPSATTILSEERLKEQDIRLLCGCAARRYRPLGLRSRSR
jgi:hypothetical protein